MEISISKFNNPISLINGIAITWEVEIIQDSFTKELMKVPAITTVTVMKNRSQLSSDGSFQQKRYDINDKMSAWFLKFWLGVDTNVDHMVDDVEFEFVNELNLFKVKIQKKIKDICGFYINVDDIKALILQPKERNN